MKETLHDACVRVCV